MKKIIGVADTTFSRVNYYPFVEQAVKDGMSQEFVNFDIVLERYTVPGIKDLPVACKILFEKHNADIVIALGMVGKEKIDNQCSHEASTAIQNVMLQQSKHILEVFVHMNEAIEVKNKKQKLNEKKLFSICKDRAYKHAFNALFLLKGKDALSIFAGHGKRQGSNHAGEIKNDKK